MLAKYEDRQVSPIDVQLDSDNPRISALDRRKNLSQSDLIELMVTRFKIEDLGRSIVATGFTDIDPLIGYKGNGDVVVREGNRRIGALKLLLDPDLAPRRHRARWKELSGKLEPTYRQEIEKVGIRVFKDPNTADLEAYIGFRHVSGILEWPAEEKARFIVDMVDRHHWGYREIAERIGSYPKHVERHYIASCLIDQAKELQIEGAENITIGVLLRALQAGGVSDFLGIEYPGEPEKSKRPVPEGKHDNLEFFVWSTFGSDARPAILPESRQLTKWGEILQSDEAIRYLKAASQPSFQRAWAKSGGVQQTVTEMLHTGADNIEDAIALVYDYAREDDVIAAVDRCTRRLKQLLRDFPVIQEKHFGK